MRLFATQNRFKLYFLIIFSVSLFMNGCSCGWDVKADNDPQEQTFINDPNSVISQYPDGKIIAGEEIVLTARNISNYESLKNTATFTWDYGDGCISTGGDTTNTGDGIAVSHIYALPGIYMITLKINISSTSIINITKNITVEGDLPADLAPLVSFQPIFELNFNKKDMSFSPVSGNPVTVQLIDKKTTTSPSNIDFINGIVGQAIDLSNGKYIRIDNINTILNNLNSYTISFWIKKKTNDSLSTLGATTRAYIMSQVGSSFFDEKLYMSIQDSTLSAKISTTDNSGNSNSINAIHAFKNGYYWQHCAITYDGSILRLYIDGTEYIGGYAEGIENPTTTLQAKPLTGNVQLSANPLFIGVKNDDTTYIPANGIARFNGYFDEFKIYNRCLTREQLFVGLELWHADFHARTSQYIDIKIPERFTSNSSARLEAFITSKGIRVCDLDGNSILQWIDKSSGNLKATERVLLNNYLLDALASPEKYTLTVRIIDSSTNKIMATKSESFAKPYAGSPACGIDENNAIRLGNNSSKGTVFYPVTCFGLNDNSAWEPGKQLKYWASLGADPKYNFKGAGQKWENPIINTGFGHGWGLNWSPGLYGSYLDDTGTDGLKAIGPTMWQGLVEYTSSVLMGQNSDTLNMIDYVNNNKEKPSMLMWSWRDEPDLHGIYSETIRAWTKLSHIYDPQHPVAVTLRGASFIPDSTPFMRTVQSYSAKYNAIKFGKITEPLNGIFVVDVLGYDYYPIDWAYPHNLDASVAATIAALENSRLYTRDMIPSYNFVETTDINEGTITPFYPSPEQLNMLAWLHVIHGMKMTPWFHHHLPTPDENFRTMGQFLKDINVFKDIIALPNSSRNIIVSVDTAGLPSWGSGVSYSSGNIVTNNGFAYICMQNHTSSASNQPLSESTIMSWKPYWKVERRVDILAKEYSGYLYIFAVRPTEIGRTTTSYTPTVGNAYTIANSIGVSAAVTISASGIPGTSAWELYTDSGWSTLSTTGGVYNTTFNVNEVNIYRIHL